MTNKEIAAARKRQFKYLLDKYIRDERDLASAPIQTINPSFMDMRERSRNLNRNLVIGYVYALIDEASNVQSGQR